MGFCYTYTIRITKGDINAKKLTITIDEEVYKGLHETIGPRKISKFVEGLVRPHVVRPRPGISILTNVKRQKTRGGSPGLGRDDF